LLFSHNLHTQQGALLRHVIPKVVTYVVNKTWKTAMEITFINKKLQKQLSEESTLVRIHGMPRAKKLKLVLAKLWAAPNLAVFAPPMSPPHRVHELTGNLQGQLSIDLDDPYRLLFLPNHNPLPLRTEGGLAWSKVTAIKIVGIEDTHG
jgi:proteic killer suppression protein